MEASNSLANAKQKLVDAMGRICTEKSEEELEVRSKFGLIGFAFLTFDRVIGLRHIMLCLSHVLHGDCYQALWNTLIRNKFFDNPFLR